MAKNYDNVIENAISQLKRNNQSTGRMASGKFTASSRSGGGSGSRAVKRVTWFRENKCDEPTGITIGGKTILFKDFPNKDEQSLSLGTQDVTAGTQEVCINKLDEATNTYVPGNCVTVDFKPFIAEHETLTSWSAEVVGPNLIFNYVDENGDTNTETINIENLVKLFETVTTFTFTGSVISYINEAGVTSNIDIKDLETTSPMVAGPNTAIGGLTKTYTDEDGNPTTFCEGFDSVKESTGCNDSGVGANKMVRSISLNGKELDMEVAPEHFSKKIWVPANSLGAVLTQDLKASPTQIWVDGPIGSRVITNRTCRPAQLEVSWEFVNNIEAFNGPSFSIRTRGFVDIGDGVLSLVITNNCNHLSVRSNVSNNLQCSTISTSRFAEGSVIIPPGGSVTVRSQAGTLVPSGDAPDINSHVDVVSSVSRVNMICKLTTLNQITI